MLAKLGKKRTKILIKQDVFRLKCGFRLCVFGFLSVSISILSEKFVTDVIYVTSL